MYTYIIYILSLSHRSLQVGTLAYLKNFRKGLRFQIALCNSQVAAACLYHGLWWNQDCPWFLRRRQQRTRCHPWNPSAGM